MKVGIVVFPGSNGDHDALYALGEVLGHERERGEAEIVWHTCTDVSRYDLVVLPGGFSYGDYLRAGAIARFSPVMEAVKWYAQEGGWVLGICNGFQVLTEAHLLPGALMRNAELSFSCRWVHVRVEPSRSLLLEGVAPGTVWRLPIAHGEGRYYADPHTLRQLNANAQIVLRYSAPDGTVDLATENTLIRTPHSALRNPNGSSEAIAGITNLEGNVLGLMPHPERAAEALLGGDDGRLFLQAIVTAWQKRAASAEAALAR